MRTFNYLGAFNVITLYFTIKKVIYIKKEEEDLR